MGTKRTMDAPSVTRQAVHGWRRVGKKLAKYDARKKRGRSSITVPRLYGQRGIRTGHDADQQNVDSFIEGADAGGGKQLPADELARFARELYAAYRQRPSTYPGGNGPDDGANDDGQDNGRTGS